MSNSELCTKAIRAIEDYLIANGWTINLDNRLWTKEKENTHKMMSAFAIQMNIDFGN